MMNSSILTVSVLEKHLDEGVVSGTDIEKQFLEVQEEPKRKQEENVQLQGTRELWKWLKRRGQAAKKNTCMKRTNKIKVLQDSLCCCSEVVLKDTRDVLVWRKRTVRDTRRNSSKKIQKSALQKKQQDQKWAVWPLCPRGVKSSTEALTTERAEGDTPGKIQLLETGEQKPQDIEDLDEEITQLLVRYHKGSSDYDFDLIIFLNEQSEI